MITGYVVTLKNPNASKIDIAAWIRKATNVLFTIDQENETLDVQWSICMGDTFNKAEGIKLAKERTPFTIKYERSMSLVDNLFLYFTKAAATNEKIPQEQRILGGRLWSLM